MFANRGKTIFQISSQKPFTSFSYFIHLPVVINVDTTKRSWQVVHIYYAKHSIITNIILLSFFQEQTGIHFFFLIEEWRSVYTFHEIGWKLKIWFTRSCPWSLIIYMCYIIYIKTILKWFWPSRRYFKLCMFL